MMNYLVFHLICAAFNVFILMLVLHVVSKRYAMQPNQNDKAILDFINENINKEIIRHIIFGPINLLIIIVLKYQAFQRQRKQ